LLQERARAVCAGHRPRLRHEDYTQIRLHVPEVVVSLGNDLCTCVCNNNVTTVRRCVCLDLGACPECRIRRQVCLEVTHLPGLLQECCKRVMKVSFECNDNAMRVPQ
jgi:hypothetical protein